MQKLEMMIETFGKQFDAELRRFFEEKSSSSQMPQEVWKDISEYVLSGGKRLRPFILHTMNSEFRRAEGNLTHILIAFELLHNYTLVDDDIIDHHDVRRGSQTLPKTYQEKYKRGRLAAILPANLLSNVGLELILNSGLENSLVDECRNAYLATSIHINLAQIEDLKQRKNLSTTEDDYLAKIERVSAMFIRYMFRLGASEDNKLEFGKIGQYLGMAFQLADDLMDVNPEKRKGRDLGSDIRMGTPTLLSIFAYSRLQGADRTRFSGLFGKEDATPAEIEWMISKYEETGAVIHVEEVIKYQISEAKKLLKAIGVDESHWTYAFADYAYKRQN